MRPSSLGNQIGSWSRVQDFAAPLEVDAEVEIAKESGYGAGMPTVRDQIAAPQRATNPQDAEPRHETAGAVHTAASTIEATAVARGELSTSSEVNLPASKKDVVMTRVAARNSSSGHRSDSGFGDGRRMDGTIGASPSRRDLSVQRHLASPSNVETKTPAELPQGAHVRSAASPLDAAAASPSPRAPRMEPSPSLEAAPLVPLASTVRVPHAFTKVRMDVATNRLGLAEPVGVKENMIDAGGVRHLSTPMETTVFALRSALATVAGPRSRPAIVAISMKDALHTSAAGEQTAVMSPLSQTAPSNDEPVAQHISSAPPALRVTKPQSLPQTLKAAAPRVEAYNSRASQPGRPILSELSMMASLPAEASAVNASTLSSRTSPNAASVLTPTLPEVARRQSSSRPAPSLDIVPVRTLTDNLTSRAGRGRVEPSSHVEPATAEPVVHITIGRVEIRASTAESRRSGRSDRSQSRSTLEDFLGASGARRSP